MTDDMRTEISPADAQYAARARACWDGIAKPLGALGLLEDAVCRLAAVQRTERPAISRRALAVFCADNGIVAEGVAQTDSSVTAAVAKNICAGTASVCAMARVARCDVFPVDMGMLTPVTHEKMTDRHVARGTRNFLHEDAMTRAQAEQAVRTGARFAQELVDRGYTVIATGEMGIGNTTTASAVASVLIALPPEAVTGAGAGLSAAGVAHKIRVIAQGIAARSPDAADPLDVLAKLGGFDIAGMAGCMLGAAARRTAVIVDGLISQVAALVAVRLCPAVRDYLFASHVGSETASRRVLAELGLSAPVQAGMHLGEGSGCMTLLPLLDLALAVYDGAATFSDLRLPAYRPL